MVEPRLAVVIPAFREEASIGAIVREAILHGEVLVIDDNSPDETRERARGAGAIVIRNPSNMGYDGTLTRGLKEAVARGFTHAITIDADGEHDPTLLPAFRAKLIDERYRLVLGIRPRKQRIAEVVMGCYFRLRYGVRDILCGMKGYCLSDLATAPVDFGGSIGTQFAADFLRRGVAFAQIPVSGRRRADAPRFGPHLRANLRILSALIRCVSQDLKSGRA